LPVSTVCGKHILLHFEANMGWGTDNETEPIQTGCCFVFLGLTHDAYAAY